MVAATCFQVYDFISRELFSFRSLGIVLRLGGCWFCIAFPWWRSVTRYLLPLRHRVAREGAVIVICAGRGGRSAWHEFPLPVRRATGGGGSGGPVPGCFFQAQEVLVAVPLPCAI